MEKRVLTGILLLPLLVFAQPSMFVGYDDFCGLPVLVEKTDQGAVATIRDGQRIILLDPSVMSNWNLSRVFALAHECGHHILGHMSQEEQFSRIHMNATRRQELQADCWAAKALASHGYYRDIERTIIQNASAGPFIQGAYPSGMERAHFIAQCAGIILPPPEFPSGYSMQTCGCWGADPLIEVKEELCTSKVVRLRVCPGWCSQNYPPYSYRCK